MFLNLGCFLQRLYLVSAALGRVWDGTGKRQFVRWKMTLGSKVRVLVKSSARWHARACFGQGVVPDVMLHGEVSRNTGECQSLSSPSLTAQLSVPRTPRCTLPCRFAFPVTCRHSLPCPFKQEEEAEPSARPCHVDRAQTPCSDVTSHGCSTSSPIHQETSNLTVFGDTSRDKYRQCGSVRVRKIEAWGLFP